MSGRPFDRDDPFLVDVVRGSVVESVHVHDAVVVALADGTTVARAGDPERVACVRSALKPLQAAASIAHGWLPTDERHVAIACASHNGEPEHVAAVRELLASALVGEEQLRCPPALPLREPDAAVAGAPARVLHNCSGKHAAFLAAARAAGDSLDSYLEPGHPLQRRVLELVREHGGAVESTTVDGCGAPVPAATLRRIALGFGRVIAANPRVAASMRAHPFLVGGTERFDTALLQAGDLVSKVGAEGLQCFASAAAGIAGAIKCRDGSSRGVAPVTLAVLERLGVLGADDPVLDAFREPVVLGGERPQGVVRLRERGD